MNLFLGACIGFGVVAVASLALAWAINRRRARRQFLRDIERRIFGASEK